MSREEAIEILSEMRAEYNLFGDEEEATRYHVLSWAIQAMKDTQQWIPVSEGLPPSREEVIVSICDETGDTRYNYTSHGWLTTDKEYWIVDNEINNYVVAWMPLPEPWCFATTQNLSNYCPNCGAKMDEVMKDE